MKQEFIWKITTVHSDGNVHFTFQPVTLEQDAFRQYYYEECHNTYYEDFTIQASVSENKAGESQDDTVYGFNMGYRVDFYMKPVMDASDLEMRYKTITRIVKGITKIKDKFGNPSNLMQYVSYISEAMGHCKGYIGLDYHCDEGMIMNLKHLECSIAKEQNCIHQKRHTSNMA